MRTSVELFLEVFVFAHIYLKCWTCTCSTRKCWTATHVHIEMSHLGTSITGMLGLHMLYNEVLHLHTCIKDMYYLNTSITGMVGLHMLCKEMLHLHTCTNSMPHLNTSITGMLGLHMLCKEVLHLHTCIHGMLHTKVLHPYMQQIMGSSPIALALGHWLCYPSHSATRAG